MNLVQAAPSLVEQAAAVRRGEISPTELVERALARLAEVEPTLGAFVAVAADRARGEAATLTAEAAAGRWRGPLHGVPVAVKDLFDVAGEVTGAGSELPPTGRPARADAAAVRRLRDAGAVVLGRTRTHEYAWGLTTQHARLGGSRNPFDPSRVPGGSSGGSAAAVAAGVVPLGLGTDTAGSIRLPAAWCGLVGHKPTHGLVSLVGAVPLAPSFDHAGALVRTVADARLALAVLTGRPLTARKRLDLAGLRVAVVRLEGSPVPEPGIDELLKRAADAASSAGAVLTDLAVAEWSTARDAFFRAQAAEALPYHRGLGHWPARADDYGPDVRARLTLASKLETSLPAVTSALAEIRSAGRAAFDDADVLLSLVAGAGPSRVAEPDTVHVAGRPQRLRDQVLPHTLLASICGLPACSVPAGLDRDGLPVGIQVIGPPGSDDLVLDVADLLHELSRGATPPDQ
jgi:aspartyl-tRNA(Asn)/glutamyl-tRNA(Gln) amidotransferase subunit A